MIAHVRPDSGTKQNVPDNFHDTISMTTLLGLD